MYWVAFLLSPTHFLGKWHEGWKIVQCCKVLCKKRHVPKCGTFLHQKTRAEPSINFPHTVGCVYLSGDLFQMVLLNGMSYCMNIASYPLIMVGRTIICMGAAQLSPSVLGRKRISHIFLLPVIPSFCGSQCKESVTDLSSYHTTFIWLISSYRSEWTFGPIYNPSSAPPTV